MQGGSQSGQKMEPKLLKVNFFLEGRELQNFLPEIRVKWVVSSLKLPIF